MGDWRDFLYRIRWYLTHKRSSPTITTAPEHCQGMGEWQLCEGGKEGGRVGGMEGGWVGWREGAREEGGKEGEGEGGRKEGEIAIEGRRSDKK